MIALAFAYIATALACTRRVYQHVRPSEVPLCDLKAGALHPRRNGGSDHPRTDPGFNGHWITCYSRWHDISYTHEAVWTALAAGLFWPLFLLGLGMFLAITWKPKETRKEKAARLAKLEKSNAAKEQELGL